MNELPPGLTNAAPGTLQHPQRRRLLVGAGAVALVLVAGVFVAGWARYRYLRSHADALLRARVIDTLSARFNSPVELDSIHLDTSAGVRVTGTGLRILYLAGPTRPDADLTAPPPMLNLASFEFTTTVWELLKPTAHILTVVVRGMQLDIPPHNRRASIAPGPPRSAKKPKISLTVGRIVCLDSRVLIETKKPGKVPLVFNIASATLIDVGPDKPLAYEATLTNPKPVGDVQAKGHFGPWNAADPRDTSLDGNYQFTHADLDTIKGLGGMLSSSGKFAGSLGVIAVDGTTDTPDFQLDISAHPVPLHTNFSVQVDGLTGDVILKRVDASLLHTALHCSGSVTRIGNAGTGVTGHDTELAIEIEHGRIEDMLTLAMKTNPPVIRGTLATKHRFSLPPGKESVSRRMKIAGSFAVSGVTFSSPSFQQTVDMISMRAQGRPKLANAEDAPVIQSLLTGSFTQADSVVNISALHYAMPGASSDLEGHYSLDGQQFEFHGFIRTQATASQMTTGWKRMLLKPIDPLLKRDGAGVQLPVTIRGTKAAPKFSIDLKHLFD